MRWNRHSEFEGKHAFLSASNHHWTNYADEKLISVYKNLQAKMIGIKLHEFAHDAITLRRMLYEDGSTLSLFVNDCIIDGLDSEVLLYFSDNAFGTADTIQFRDGLLRIHDLKTGVTPAHMEQLEIYAALFCLEYDHKPGDIEIELRIYQTDDIIIFNPPAEDIGEIMNKIVVFDKIISQIRMEEDL